MNRFRFLWRWLVETVRVQVKGSGGGQRSSTASQTIELVQETDQQQTPPKAAPKPEDFVNRPSTQRLQNKIEEWQKAALVSGTH